MLVAKELNPDLIQERVVELRDLVANEVKQEMAKVKKVSSSSLEEIVMVRVEEAFERFKAKVEKEFNKNVHEHKLAMIFVKSLKRDFYSPDLLQREILILYY